MALRGLDIHAHVRTGERRQVGATHRDAEKLFGSGDLRQADPVPFYQERDLMAVVFDVDTETANGERMSNDEIVTLVGRSEGSLIGFATVDPWKGRAAIRELERCVEMGMRGLKVQPITQAFWLHDERFRPVWDACQSLGLPVLIHMGTTAIGAGSPGGRGFQLKYGKPVPALDDVAAAFPNLNLIAAHFAWPWHLELLAVARHKGNVHVDLSGWAPKYIPPEVIRYCNSVMPEKFLFGTDFPLFNPDRWLAEFAQLELKDGVRDMVMFENACRLLSVDPVRFARSAQVEH
jgi:hypothetical protein